MRLRFSHRCPLPAAVDALAGLMGPARTAHKAAQTAKIRPECAV